MPMLLLIYPFYYMMLFLLRDVALIWCCCYATSHCRLPLFHFERCLFSFSLFHFIFHLLRWCRLLRWLLMPFSPFSIFAITLRRHIAMLLTTLYYYFRLFHYFAINITPIDYADACHVSLMPPLMLYWLFDVSSCRHFLSPPFSFFAAYRLRCRFFFSIAPLTPYFSLSAMLPLLIFIYVYIIVDYYFTPLLLITPMPPFLRHFIISRLLMPLFFITLLSHTPFSRLHIISPRADISLMRALWHIFVIFHWYYWHISLFSSRCWLFTYAFHYISFIYLIITPPDYRCQLRHFAIVFATFSLMPLIIFAIDAFHYFSRWCRFHWVSFFIFADYFHWCFHYFHCASLFRHYIYAAIDAIDIFCFH